MPNKRWNIHGVDIFRERGGWRNGAFYGYTCWGMKITKKIDSKSIMCFCCLTSLQFRLAHHYLLPWERQRVRERFINGTKLKRDGDMLVDEDEEWGRGYFTEKSCTRKDINAMAFFPLRLIENYIPSFIRQWRRRARENANICYEK